MSIEELHPGNCDTAVLLIIVICMTQRQTTPFDGATTSGIIFTMSCWVFWVLKAPFYVSLRVMWEFCDFGLQFVGDLCLHILQFVFTWPIDYMKYRVQEFKFSIYCYFESVRYIIFSKPKKQTSRNLPQSETRETAAMTVKPEDTRKDVPPKPEQVKNEPKAHVRQRYAGVWTAHSATETSGNTRQTRNAVKRDVPESGNTYLQGRTSKKQAIESELDVQPRGVKRSTEMPPPSVPTRKRHRSSKCCNSSCRSLGTKYPCMGCIQTSHGTWLLS